MKSTTIAFLFAGIFLLLSHSLRKKTQDKFLKIPTQHLNLTQFVGDSIPDKAYDVPAFEISKQVTFREYKQYLAAIRKDSSDRYYRSQLPDSSIAKRADWETYISDEIYNDYPVLGVSWENAMNYCRWKTLKDNKKDILFLYRLPHCSEWLAAKVYLETNKLESDFSKNYSDWLFGSKDESMYDMRSDAMLRFPYDYAYLHKSTDPLAMKRKLVIGDSYRYQAENQSDCFFSYYATQGYRQVGFRMVKERSSTDEDGEIVYSNIAFKILDHWNLIID